ncbi:MAG: hypothetical protein ACTSSB_11350 [Candidatus Heimdallarchaeota archaeon]
MKEHEKKYTNRRVQGDSLYYFCFHNLISILLFFLFALNLKLFESQSDEISQILSIGYVQLLFMIFGISLLCGILGRIIAYILLKMVFKNKPIKTFGEFNQGINKISMSYLLSTFVSAVIFSIGAFAILQNVLFDEESLFTLMATYIIIKIGVYLATRMFSSFKL